MIENKKKFKSNNAITLIALIITIIVLLILAGITIITLKGNNGILKKVGDAKNKNIDSQIEEEIRLAWNKMQIDGILNNWNNENKRSALETELKKNDSNANVQLNNNKLSITYKERFADLDISTGKLKVTRERDLASQLELVGNLWEIINDEGVLSGYVEFLENGKVNFRYKHSIFSGFWMATNNRNRDFERELPRRLFPY